MIFFTRSVSLLRRTVLAALPQKSIAPRHNSSANFPSYRARLWYEMEENVTVNGAGNGARANGNPEAAKTPFLIGVAGGTASGKSTVCKRIMEQLGQADMDHTQRQVVTISQDSFYRELTEAEKIRAERGLFNFDHPSAFNEELMLQTLQDILHGKKVEINEYDYRRNTVNQDRKVTIYPADVVLFEGILVFYFPAIRDLFHMKLFVDTDSDTRLARRVPRDINERGRDLEQVLNAYMSFVKPAFEEFCSPTKKFADVVIPRGADNTVAIDLIVQHIREFLNNRTRSDHSPHLATCGTSALNLASGRDENHPLLSPTVAAAAVVAASAATMAPGTRRFSSSVINRQLYSVVYNF